jgi:hypothetical protein
MKNLITYQEYQQLEDSIIDQPEDNIEYFHNKDRYFPTNVTIYGNETTDWYSFWGYPVKNYE